ncbi:hypothetical protein GZL_09360 [Streptomyces sp. 769]|nr:hypothetical protein GZL_00053 [Streptomyces sp. 769]AJC61878.1 hypothetical protein GZL_09360 [Streptomyces sp. 769]
MLRHTTGRQSNLVTPSQEVVFNPGNSLVEHERRGRVRR